MRSLSFILLITLIFLSCDNTKSKKKHEKKNPRSKTEVINSLQQTDTIVAVDENIPKNLIPVFGYRFIINGDFDGDGKKEKLTEHFFSSINNKETHKFYDSLTNYDQLVELTIKKSPYSFLSCDNTKINSFQVANSGQLLGLSYLKNEGDINGDGTDEISYVINWADWSNLNTWHIAAYKNKEWKDIYTFDIWDWQIPDLPETFNQYGLFGLQDKIINTSEKEINQQLESKLLEFEGLVKKIKKNKIQVIYKTDEAEEDTMIVNLKRIK